MASILKEIKDNISTTYDVKIEQVRDNDNNVIVLRSISGVKNINEIELENYMADSRYIDINILMRLENTNGAYEELINTLEDVTYQISQLLFKNIGDKQINKFDSEEIDYIGKDKQGRVNATRLISIMYN